MNTTELLEAAEKDLAEINKTIDIVAKDKAKAKKVYEKALKAARKRFAPKK